MKVTKSNRLLSFLLAFVTLFNMFGSFLPSVALANNRTNDRTNDRTGEQVLLTDKGKCGKFLTYDGEEIQAVYVMYEDTDGNEYPAYCMEPSFQGVGSWDITYGEYTIRGKIDNDKVWRVAKNGYPYKSLGSYGVMSEREAFFATKHAIYRTLDDAPLNYGSLNPEGANMVEAIRGLYDIGQNGTERYVEPKLTITPKTTETVIDETNPQYKSQTFTVEGNCEFNTYEVLFNLSDLPAGTKITDENGIEQTTFEAGEKFKVMVPVNENDISAFRIDVQADLKSYPIYYAESENIRMQVMLITCNPYETVKQKASVTLNKTIANITINKKDAVTGEGIPNTTFEVKKVDGQIVGTYVTGEDGSVSVPVNQSGYYKVTEIEPNEAYLMSEVSEQIINVQFNIDNEVTFLNNKKGTLEIVKIDKDTGRPIANVRYRVSKTDGTIIGEYTTNSAGKISIQGIEPQWVEILEISPATNYIKDETIHKIQVVENEVTTITLTNKELKGIQILKKDTVTGEPLSGATFRVTRVGGSVLGEYTTDERGMIVIDHVIGFFEIEELSAPRGYIKSSDKKIVEVTENESAIVEYTNTAKGGLQIKKIDEQTGEPIPNVKFRVTTLTGQVIGEFTTSRTGFIVIPEIDDRWVVIEEIYVNDEYILDNTPKTVEIREDKPTIVEFTNRKKGGIQILKTDADTGVPLSGAKFRVTTKNGTFIGEYTTDAQGHINLPSMPSGWITILEVQAPKGYILDDVKRDVEVTHDKNVIVEFTNRMKAGLQIKKIDFNTGEPLEGAKFRVSKANGEVIGEYVTSKTGFINLYDLDEGYYICEELLAPNRLRFKYYTSKSQG